MSAILPADQRTPLPRANAKGMKSQSQRGIAQAVAQYRQTSAALRYQHLPDYDPNDTVEKIEARLRERFAVMRMMTKKAIRGKARAVVVSGPGGVGKTFDVDRILDEWDPEGEKYTTSSGYVRATGLYKLLYQHRHKGNLVKFDDSDSLFYDDTCLNFLKIACDTTKTRTLAYRSEKVLFDEDGQPLPKSFDFNGTMLFISNLDFDQMIDRGTKLAPHLEALITRSHYINMGMRTKFDYLVRLSMIVYPRPEDKHPGLFDDMGLEKEEIDEVYDFIEKNHRLLRECSLRMGLKIGMLRQMAEEDDEIPWQNQAVLTCCRSGTELVDEEEEEEEPDIAPGDIEADVKE